MVCLSHFRKAAAKSLTLEMKLSSPRFTISTWTVCFLHTRTHNCRKKKKSKQLPTPQDLLSEKEEGGRGLQGHPSCQLVQIMASQHGKDIRDLLVQVIDKKAERSAVRW